MNEGFKIQGALKSVSFSRTSELALGYACNARSAASPNGCMNAVLYESINRRGIVIEAFGLHDYTLDPQPVVIGYRIVPAEYRFT